MAVTRTGTASQLDASAGNGSTSATVPADCNVVVAFWSHFDGNTGTTLSSLTLNGVAFTISAQLAEGAATDEAGIGVAVLPNPATGSQTVAWTWSGGGARSEGGEIVLVYLTGANTSTPARDAAVNATTATDNLEVTVTSDTTDIVIAFAQSFSLSNPALSGTVFINNTVLNSHSYDVSQVTAGASTTTVTMTGEDYSAMAAISIREASAGGTTTAKTMTETLTMADAALDPTQRVRQMSDTTVLTDAEVHWTRRVRLLSDTLDAIDSVVKSVATGAGVFTKVMSDTLTAVDSVLQWLRRVRGQIDTVTITDGDTLRQSIVTASDDIVTTDETVLWRRIHRVMEEDLTLIDAFSKTLIGVGIVYAKVMSETVTLIDDAGQRWALRLSQLSEAVGLSDVVVQSILRIRTLGEDIEFSDGIVTVARYLRSVDESVQVTDGQVSTLYLDQLSSVSFAFGSGVMPFGFGTGSTDFAFGGQ